MKPEQGFRSEDWVYARVKSWNSFKLTISADRFHQPISTSDSPLATIWLSCCCTGTSISDADISQSMGFLLHVRCSWQWLPMKVTPAGDDLFRYQLIHSCYSLSFWIVDLARNSLVGRKKTSYTCFASMCFETGEPKAWAKYRPLWLLAIVLEIK